MRPEDVQTGTAEVETEATKVATQAGDIAGKAAYIEKSVESAVFAKAGKYPGQTRMTLAEPAVLAVLPDAPVRLDSALAGEETLDAASPETLPTAADDSPAARMPIRVWPNSVGPG